MTYDSLDIIPLKLFIKISNTRDYSLLTDEKDVLFDTKKIFQQLEAEYEALGLDKNMSKILDIHKRIEALKLKYDCVMMAVQSLKFEKNVDLLNILNEFRYKQKESESYMQYLQRVEGEIKAINIKIKRLEMKLPKSEDKDKSQVTIDRVILGYCAITGLTYNTNKITVTQFHALKLTAEDKIKAVEEARAKSEGKSKHKRRR